MPCLADDLLFGVSDNFAYGNALRWHPFLRRQADPPATASSLSLSDALRLPQSAYCSFHAYGRGFHPRQFPAATPRKILSLCMAKDVVPTGLVGQVPLYHPGHPSGDRIRHHPPLWQSITYDRWVLKFVLLPPL